jgi:recombination associated protein RdgC
LQIKKLAFLDTVFEGKSADDGGFDTDLAIATGEITRLLPDLLEALGGEAEFAAASDTAVLPATTLSSASPTVTRGTSTHDVLATDSAPF